MNTAQPDIHTPPWEHPEPRLGIRAVDDAAIRYLSGRWGQLHLQADDGPLVTLEIAKVRQRMLIATYLDGRMQLTGLTAKDPADLPADLAPWLRQRSRYIHSARLRTPEARKSHGAMIKHGHCSIFDPDARIHYLDAWWDSPAACIRHLRHQRPQVLTPHEGERRLHACLASPQPEREVADAAEVSHGA
jgi:hypothetical protein